MVKSKGRVTEVRGPVIDARFEKGKLPRVNDALRIKREGDNDLVLEVAQHLGDDVVRAIAMDSTRYTERTKGFRMDDILAGEKHMFSDDIELTW